MMSHTCPECQRVFKNRLALSVHFGRVHKKKGLPPAQLDPKEYPFLCQVCNTRRFKSRRGLSYHVSKTHGVKLSKEEKKQRQTDAIKRYSIKKRKEQPQLYPHECPLCEFRGLSRGGLSTHMTRMHLGHIYFSHPVHVGFNGRTSKRCLAPYDEKTMEWLEHLSNKNLLVFYLNNRASKGLIPSLKRNKIINNYQRCQWKGRNLNLTTYGKGLLTELQEEGRLSARIIAGALK